MKRMTVKEAAELLNVNPQYIRVGLQQKQFKWGYAEKGASKWHYYIDQDSLEKEIKDSQEKRHD